MKRRKLHAATTREKIRDSCLRRVMPLGWKGNVKDAVIRRCAKPVYCKETGDEFESISAAARSLGVTPIQVSRVCNGKRSSIHGQSFIFTSDAI